MRTGGHVYLFEFKVVEMAPPGSALASYRSPTREPMACRTKKSAAGENPAMFGSGNPTGPSDRCGRVSSPGTLIV